MYPMIMNYGYGIYEKSFWFSGLYGSLGQLSSRYKKMDHPNTSWFSKFPDDKLKLTLENAIELLELQDRSW